ncbi:MAG: Branched-chain amino acid transport ATP-binding protein LivG, partial [uncultured Acidimicrobiales bacterium]
ERLRVQRTHGRDSAGARGTGRHQGVRRADRGRRGRPRGRRAGDRRPDRPERRRQDHVLQLPDRDGDTHQRAHQLPGTHAERQAASGHRERPGPHLPEHPTVPQHDRPGERAGGPPLPHEPGRALRARPWTAVSARGSRWAGSRPRAAAVRRDGPSRRDAGSQPALRRPAAARDSPGARHRSGSVAPRRAHSRHEPAGDGVGHAARTPHPGAGAGHRGDRARHALHLQPLRPGGRARPGTEAGRGHRHRGAAGPESGGGLPGQAGGRWL